jgi:hypothetical protein
MNSALRFVAAALLLSFASFASAQVPPGAIETYPQVVRVSLVEGDVRVSRGKAGQKATGAAWEKAAVDLPLEAGFSLVTGADGRAEIEFEDASTAYLAENSVLVFNDLSSTNGLPRTDLGLLSGTMTIDVKLMGPGEWFSVKTPTDGFTVRYPYKAYLRVNSYLDGMSLTAMRSTMLHMNVVQPVNAQQGETFTFHSGQRMPADKAVDNSQFAAWDDWVSKHAAERDEAMQAAMKDAGLSAPIPGLAEMNQRGTFYPCAPYGTCWEPKDQVAASGSSDSQAAQSAQLRPEDPAVTARLAQQTVSVNALQQGGGSQPGVQVKTNGPRSGLLAVNYDDFPCSPWWQRSLLRRDPATGLFVMNPYPYRWAVCHTGTWIERRHRYVWVVGTHRHHHHPVHWVKNGKAVGYVPIHPRDVNGQTPLNLKNGLMKPVDMNGGVEHIAYADGDKLKLLDEAPKEFRRDEFPLLERSEAPHPVAFRLADRGVRGTVVDNKLTAVAVRPAGVPVTFDHKTQSFMVAQTVQHGSGTRTVAEPIGGRGSSVQAYSHSGGGSESARGGGYSGGSSSASRGSYSGGSSYSGGGGGAASHASAPAASAPAASSPAASSGGGAAASSGGGGKR